MSRLLTGLLLALIVLPPAFAAEPVIFRVEPQFKRTFSHSGVIPAHSEVLLEVSGLQGNQRFVASRCGEDCNTAKTVFEVAGQGRGKFNRAFGVERAARYYFYVQKKDAGGAVGPVTIIDLQSREDGFLATFEGGVTITGVIHPARAPEPPSAERGKDAVEILGVSPSTLTRGVPTEVTIDVRISLQSEFEARASLTFNSAGPGQFSGTETRVVKPGTQNVTFVTDVVPVDWGERGQFTVAVSLLPVEMTESRVRALAVASRKLEVVP